MGSRMSNIATPMPQIRARFTSKLGIPLSGCKVYTYEPNSNIPKTTWIDIDKTVENTNPILLDAAGEADIFLDGLYQIVVKDRFGFIVYDVEKIGYEQPVFNDSLLLTWSGRTQEQKNKDLIHVLDFKVGDKTDQQTIVDAVAYCYANNRILNWDGANLNSTANIDSFWSISHCGQGLITRNDSVFYINPKDHSSTNTVFVSPTGSTNNDGLSKTEPKTLLSVVSLLGNLGDFSLNAQWKVKLLKGTYTDEGLRISKFPKTTLPVIFEGDDLVAGRTVSNWSGLSSVNAFAFRLDSCDSMKNMSFLKVGFSDWSAEAGNAGALVGNNFESLNFDQCEFLRMPIGVWATRSKGTVTRSLFEDCSTWGICAQHNSRFNVGNTNNGMGNTFRRCGSAVASGRLSVVYTENNDFYEVTRAIEGNKYSRVRVGANRYHSWASTPFSGIQCLYFLAERALFNRSAAETYNLAPSTTKPIYFTQQGSLNAEISTVADKMLAVSTPLSETFSANTRVPVTNANPLRIPAYAFYTQAFSVDVEIVASMSAGKSATVEISGAGSSAATVIARAVLPAPTETKAFRIKFKIYRGASGIAYYDVECPALNYFSYANASGGINSLNSFVVAPNDSTIVFRTYVEPSAASGSIIFYFMESWISI